MKTTISARLESLKQVTPENYGFDFLLTGEKSENDLRATVLCAEILKMMHKLNYSFRVFDTGLAIPIFRDKSTRTRFSFASAANALGLSVVDLDEEKSQIAHGETVRETANMISFLAEVIGIRDDMYLGEGNKYMRDVSQAVEMGYQEGTLHRRPGIINLQCDIDHPTQTMADLAKLKHYFGSLENLRGKKLAMSWAYSPSYGKPLSVPQGIITLMTRMGMDVHLAHPEGYDLLPEMIAQAKVNAEKNGGSFTITDNMNSAFENAYVVYPKSWAPFHIMKRRTELLKTGDKAGLDELEQECLKTNANFIDWECNSRRMELTKDGEALYMHCLPADISGVSCDRGEVSQTVFEKYRIDTYQEAGYKPFIIAAMIFLARFPDPVNKLSYLLNKY